MSRRFLANLSETKEQTEEQIAAHLCDLVRSHDEWRSHKCINLQAADSAISPMAESLLRSDLERRTITGEIGSRTSKGARYADEIEELTAKIAKELFDCTFVEHRAITTSIADAMLIRVLTKPGDTILALEEPRGHPTWREIGYSGFRDLSIVDIPFDYENWNIDLEGLRSVVQSLRGKKVPLAIVGSSLMLFPYPLADIREITEELGTKLWYDGAHVLGLIAGKKFQDPLREGADVLSGTSNKTLSGPMGGLILHNDKVIDASIRTHFPGFLSIIGHNRFASLAITLLEFKRFGSDYAQQIIANAKALAGALQNEGINVLAKNHGYTQSHMLLVNVKDLGGLVASKKLEDSNIICSACKLFSKQEPFHGIRIGVTEVTRHGMKEHDMLTLASLIKKVIRDGVDVKSEVASFNEGFQDVLYRF